MQRADRTSRDGSVARAVRSYGFALAAVLPAQQPEPPGIGAAAPPLALVMLRGGPIDLPPPPDRPVLLVQFLTGATRSGIPADPIDLRAFRRLWPRDLRTVTVIGGGRPAAERRLETLPPSQHPVVGHDRELRAVRAWLAPMRWRDDIVVLVDRHGRIAFVDEPGPVLFETLARVLEQCHDPTTLAPLADLLHGFGAHARHDELVADRIERILALDPGEPRAWLTRWRNAPNHAKSQVAGAALAAIRTRPRLAWFLVHGPLGSAPAAAGLREAERAQLRAAFAAVPPQPWSEPAEDLAALRLAAAAGDGAAAAQAAGAWLLRATGDPAWLLRIGSECELWILQQPAFAPALGEIGLRAASIAGQNPLYATQGGLQWLRLGALIGMPEPELRAVAEHCAAQIEDPQLVHAAAVQFLGRRSRLDAALAVTFAERMARSGELFARSAEMHATAALACFRAGQVARAVELQERAIQIHGRPDGGLVARLGEYRAALGR